MAGLASRKKGNVLGSPELALGMAVETVLPEYWIASRINKMDDTLIQVEDVLIGSSRFVVIAGPCAVESKDLLMDSARAVKEAGGAILRGGAYKPRSSPYSFQGLAEDGLKLLDAARAMTGLPFVTEVMDSEDVPLVESYADILQVGARNVQNFALLKRVGRAKKPVLLKRGMMTTIDEFLMCAEYVLSAGNSQVILCERGIRTFETSTRFTLDLSAVPILKERTHLPVIVDPSHAVGSRQYVRPLAKAAMAVGADGVMVEVHPAPQKALCDGGQALAPDHFCKLMDDLRAMSLPCRREI